MFMKCVYQVVLSFLVASLCAGCINTPPSVRQPQPAVTEWRKQVFPQIGLEMELPNWNAIIDDQESMWTLFAFPLVDRPVASTQFGVTIQVARIRRETFRLSFKAYDGSGDLYKWRASEHPQADQHGNRYWLFSRKDIVSGEYVYYCDGELKRVGEAWEFDKTDRVGPDFVRTAGLAMQRIFESIRVVPKGSPQPKQ